MVCQLGTSIVEVHHQEPQDYIGNFPLFIKNKTYMGST
jgi:hypothetical protein